MGYLNKIGNFLGDVGSFALPAGLTAGATLLSGGTLNPATAGGLMSLLGTLGAGSSGLQANEQEERARKYAKMQQEAFAQMQAENARKTGQAGLINALMPGANARPDLQTEINVAPPKAGALERIAGGVGTGVQAVQAIDMANQGRKLLESKLADAAAQREMQKLQMQGAMQGIEQNRRAMQEQFGAAAERAGGQVPIRVESPYNTRTPDVSTRMMGLQESGAPPAVLGGAMAQREATAAAQQKAAMAAQQQALEVSKHKLNLAKFGQELQAYQQALTGGPTAGLPPEKIASMEDTLRGDFTTLTKDFRSVRDSYQRVVASSSDPSPAGDLALIFNYMKILDPGSVVRESEFAQAAASGSYGDRIQAAMGRVASGQRLSDDMRMDFVARAEKLYKAQEQSFFGLAEQFKGIAQRRGLDLQNVNVGGGLYSQPGAQPQQGGQTDPAKPALLDTLMQSTGLDPESLLDSLIQERQRRKTGGRSLMDTVGRASGAR